jgi:hypothetical protein|tara:strand:- start:2536 stop:3327 length:792 start_codon:yes stop_codon:yes gene_type:complete
MLNKILIAHNNGLGDCILMSGGIRHLATIFDEVSLICIGDHNIFRQVSYLHRDVSNINVIGEPKARNFQMGRKKIERYRKRHPNWHVRGFWWHPSEFPRHANQFGLDPNTHSWPELFYTYMVGGAMKEHMGYNHRYDSFHVLRDYDKEQRLKEELLLPDRYVFVVEAGSNCRHPYHPDGTQYPVFKPSHRSDLFDRYTIFDWMGVIEDAEEVYALDTSWFHLMKQMRLQKPKFYINRRTAPMSGLTTTNYLNDEWDNGWEVIA